MPPSRLGDRATRRMLIIVNAHRVTPSTFLGTGSTASNVQAGSLRLALTYTASSSNRRAAHAATATSLTSRGSGIMTSIIGIETRDGGAFLPHARALKTQRAAAATATAGSGHAACATLATKKRRRWDQSSDPWLIRLGTAGTSQARTLVGASGKLISIINRMIISASRRMPPRADPTTSRRHPGHALDSGNRWRNR